jgi:hypothetical protein
MLDPEIRALAQASDFGAVGVHLLDGMGRVTSERLIPRIADRQRMWGD